MPYDDNNGWRTIAVDDQDITPQSEPVGFEELLQQVGQNIRTPLPFDALLEIGLTLGGRQSLNFGRRALSERELALIDLMGPATFRPSHDADIVAPHGALHVMLREHGRLVIDTLPPRPGDVLLARRNLSAEERKSIDRLTERTQAQVRQARSLALDHFERLNDTARQQLITVVREGIDHIDPIIIYVHDVVLTNFGKFNNLLGKNSESQAGTLLDDLETGKARELSGDEIEFLYCFHQLKLGGFRGEEFCGQQLTVPRLARYLRDKVIELSRCAGVPAEPSESLVKNALLCAQLKKAMRPEYFVYRKINGLCFNKTEHYCHRRALSLDTGRVPKTLRNFLHKCGVDAAEHRDVDSLFACAVDRACESTERNDDGLHAVERLVLSVVESACVELGSAVGMSRGLRDLSQWARTLDEKAYGLLVDAPTSEYFCAVAASPALRRQLSSRPGMLTKTLTAISTRMTFNSWHYTPGHFVGVEGVTPRHYYFPPRMADTAVWSDQHHAGHVFAQVRNSIRSPGSLVIGKRKFAGLFDLRLMRSDGPPYTQVELVRAREFTAYLRAIYQALVHRHEAGKAIPAIKAFSKDWYAKHAQ